MDLQHPMAGADYSHILGANILAPDLKDDPFGGRIPGDAKGYAQFQTYYEQRMIDILGGQGTLKITANCETTGPHDQPQLMRGQKKEHLGADMCFACHHVIHQDPVNPEGVWFVPLARGSAAGYWMCSTCYRFMAAYKFDLNNIFPKCSLCVLDTLMRIRATHPERLHNLAAR